VLPPKDTIAVYPEGGSLIAGIECNVAFRYTGRLDRIKISLRNSNQEIRSFDINRDSINTIKFTPSIGANYYFECTDLTDKFYLPHVKESGISLGAEPTNPGIKINLASSEKYQRNEFYLLVYDNSGLSFSTRVDFSSELKKEIQLPQNLRAGIAQVILVDSKFTIWAERVIFIGDFKQRNAKIDGLLSAYSTRSMVKFNLQVPDNFGYSSLSRISCSVYNSDFMSEDKINVGYMNFRSDIDHSFELANKTISQQVINNYLITQSCPWFNWRLMTSKEVVKPQHIVQSYQILSGIAVYSKNKQPVRDSTLLMFFLQKSLRGYETYALKNGHFQFPLVLNINTTDRFFFTASYKGRDAEDIQVKIKDADSLMVFSSDKWSADMSSPDAYGVFYAQKRAIQNSYSFFTSSKHLSDSLYDANKPIEEELIEADVTAYLKDYLVMPGMDEVVKEILRLVEHRKINGRDVIRVYTTTKTPSKYAGPLYVIDGVLTKDVTQFMGLKPADIIYIKVVRDNKKLFALGRLGENGVIIVKTKNESSVIEKSQIDFSGLLPQRASRVQNPANQSPSFNSCIFWSPNLKLNESGLTEVSFSTTDDIGNFKIVISGEASDGTPIYTEFPLSVSLR